MTARRAVAVMVSRFPLVTETFILRELIEIERQGQPVLLVPMLREHPRVVHEEAKPWVERALYTPYMSAAILRALLRRPLRCLALLARLVAGSISSPGMLARTLALFPKSVWLAGELEAQGIRHVHAHFATHPATMAMIVSELTGIGFSITAHAHDIFVDQTLLRMKMRRAKFIRAISKFNREFLARLDPQSAEKIHVIHVGIEPERYGPSSSSPDAARGGGEEPLLLSVAAFKPYKGLPVLIDACARLAEEGVRFRCEVIGDGPQRGEIEARIGAYGLGDRIVLTGNLPQHEVAGRMRRATLMVLPSVVAPDGQMEGIPVALMEAMAAEVPVIATALSGIPELVQDGTTGLLVQPGDPAALAAAIRRLLDDRAHAAALARAGSEKVRAEFVLSSTVQQLVHALDRVNEAPALTPSELALIAADGHLGVRRVHQRQDSRVLEISAAGNEWIVKSQIARAGQSRPPAERARHEFEILQRLSAIGAAPRPLRVAGEAILMERAAGTALDRMIRDGRSSPQQLVPAFRAAGRWLRRFQTAMPGMQHGDLWPGNVFADGERVQVIDYEGVRPGSPERDVENFLNMTRKFFARPQHRRNFRIVRDAFLEGYGRG